jgi:hypothetical protein
MKKEDVYAIILLEDIYEIDIYELSHDELEVHGIPKSKLDKVLSLKDESGKVYKKVDDYVEHPFKAKDGEELGFYVAEMNKDRYKFMTKEEFESEYETIDDYFE